MRKKLILSAVTIMSLGTLAACQNKTRPVVEEKTSISTPASSSSSDSSSVSLQSSSEEKKSTTPWDSNKDQQLESFINSWAPTMNQSYQKYTGGAPLHTIVGTDYPDVFKTMPFEMNGQRISIGYTPTGKGNYDYNVVAIYNYNKRAMAGGHITYLFAFHNGQPVALVDQTTEGGVTVVKPTANQQVASSFASIAGGSNTGSTSSNQAASKSNQSQGTAVTKEEIAKAYWTLIAKPKGWDVESVINAVSSINVTDVSNMQLEPDLSYQNNTYILSSNPAKDTTYSVIFQKIGPNQVRVINIPMGHAKSWLDENKETVRNQINNGRIVNLEQGEYYVMREIRNKIIQ